MIELSLIDKTFGHLEYNSTLGTQKDYIGKWNRHRLDTQVIFTDDCILDVMNGKFPHSRLYLYGWLIESPGILYNVTSRLLNNDYVDNNISFKKIFTYDKSILDNMSNSVFTTFGNTWIKDEDHYVYNKTKDISFIFSDKNWLQGHQLRHIIANETYDKTIDKFGNGYQKIDYKLTGLKDYKYHVVVENCKKDFYFTEKLIDCFMTGTIPIYWGCPSIGNFFDKEGILTFDSLDELTHIINNVCTDEYYYNHMEYIKNNLNLAQKFKYPDNQIFKFFMDEFN